MRKSLLSVCVLAVCSFLPGTVRGELISHSPLVPPPNGVYLTPSDVHATYSGPGLLIELKDIQHLGFTNIVRLPYIGGTHETFDSLVQGLVSVNGSPFAPISLAGPVAVDLFGYTPGDLGTFQTEMLALDLVGGGAMIRESPTLASTGQTSISDLGGGLYRIDSFFDVFTELSLDGGQTWIPSNESTHVDLNSIPEPSTFALLGLGGIGLAFGAYRRRQATAV